MHSTLTSNSCSLASLQVCCCFIPAGSKYAHIRVSCSPSSSAQSCFPPFFFAGIDPPNPTSDSVSETTMYHLTTYFEYMMQSSAPALGKYEIKVWRQSLLTKTNEQVELNLIWKKKIDSTSAFLSPPIENQWFFFPWHLDLYNFTASII